MLKAILKFLGLSWSKERQQGERLYYLSGIKPIGADKKVMDECTVTK